MRKERSFHWQHYIRLANTGEAFFFHLLIIIFYKDFCSSKLRHVLFQPFEYCISVESKGIERTCLALVIYLFTFYTITTCYTTA